MAVETRVIPLIGDIRRVLRLVGGLVLLALAVPARPEPVLPAEPIMPVLLVAAAVLVLTGVAPLVRVGRAPPAV